MRSACLFILLVLILPVALLPAANARDDTWSGTFADQVISFDDNEYARAVQIFTSYDVQGLHAVWGEDAPSVREIHYGRSLDNGVTWTSSSADLVISFPDGHGVDPEECDITGFYPQSLVVVWSEDVEATREVHYGVSTDGGETWSSQSQDWVLSDPATLADTNVPSITADHDGVLHVVWTQPSIAGTIEVHYSRSTDGGATWSGTAGDRMISFPDGSGASSPQIVLQDDGNLIVVWRESGATGLPAIHAGRSTDGGDTWSSETADREISQPATIITNLAASAEPCFHIGTYVVYTATFDNQSPYHYEVYSTASLDHGLTWSGETTIVPVSYDEAGGRSASNPDVFVGIGQGAIAAWDEEDEGAGTNEQHISYGHGPFEWTGATHDEIVSYPDGEDGYRPSISGLVCTISIPDGPRDVLDDTYIAWTEFAGGASDNYEVHLSSIQLVTNGVEDDAAAADPHRLRAAPNPASGFVMLTRAVDGPGVVEIFDSAGRRVRTLTSAAARVFWDRLDASGHAVSPGCYFARAGSARTMFVLN